MTKDELIENIHKHLKAIEHVKSFPEGFRLVPSRTDKFKWVNQSTPDENGLIRFDGMFAEDIYNRLVRNYTKLHHELRELTNKEKQMIEVIT